MAKLQNIIEKDRSAFQAVSFVLREALKGSRKYTILRFIIAIISTSINFLQFGSLAIILDEFARQGISHARPVILMWSFILLAVSTLVPAIVTAFDEKFSGIQYNDLDRHMQGMQFERLDEIDIGTIEQPEFQNILQLTQSRSWNSFFAIIRFLNQLVSSGTVVIVATISLLIISPLAFGIIFITCIPTYFLQRQSARLSSEKTTANSELFRIWTTKSDLLAHKDPLMELKNFNLVKIFHQKFLNAIGKFHYEFLNVYNAQLKNDILVQLFLTVGFAGAFAILIHNVLVGVLVVGSLVFCFNAVSKFQSSLNTLFDQFGRLAAHVKNINTLMDFYEMKPMIISGPRMLNQKDDISIRLQNVSFAYPGTDRIILNKISLSISQGDNIAIVGLNGAGKTTLIKLLTRVYDPTEGEIFVNEIPLKEYNLESWKSKLAILLQEYSMYAEETVEENIMLGNSLKRNKAFAKKSATEATIAKTIASLPNKYEQRVGTEFRGGVEFSKGQKQKLALARTLYRNASIMILDEPTASIDAVSEDVIFKNLQSSHIKQTRVIISHKFSNVRDADQIILIKDGQILEQGNHDYLMSLGGEYARLFAMQAEGYR